MNADVFKGKWGQFKGELKRQWGKITDDDLVQIEGNYEKFLGKVQERWDPEGRYCRLGGQVVPRHQAGSSETRTRQITFT